MTIDISAFSFDASALNLDANSDFVAHVPRGLGGRDALFEALCRTLQLPAYFGNNWDALSECLRDLSWIERHRVVLLHQDLPPLGMKEIETYLDILSECVRDWKLGEAHELVVVFPPEAHDRIVK